MATYRYGQAGYSDPLNHPYELLGFPGGSLFYDFQEQGFGDPVSVYDALSLGPVAKWPPVDSPIGKFPKDQCWSRWLTIPDAAGSVFVDEPCIAVITATVKGNYFFTPCLRVHGMNVAAQVIADDKIDIVISGGADDTIETTGVKYTAMRGYWKGAHRGSASLADDRINAGVIEEGMQQSVQLRLGLFVDTNPIVWDDEFFNGDSFGRSARYGAGVRKLKTRWCRKK